MNTALVTGASGFIGAHLIGRLLREGMRVHAVARRPFEAVVREKLQVFACDIRDEYAMREAAADCDTVLHLAGRAHAVSELDNGKHKHQSVNVDGTRNVLAAAEAAGATAFLFFSSVKAMGEGGQRCLDETAEPRPTTAYGRTKLEAERLVIEHGSRLKLHAVCLRLPVVYGPGNKGNIYRMIDWTARGLFPPLPEVGNRRSIAHVANVVEAACLAAVSPAASGQTYIVTDRRPYSSRELYELICKGLGRAIPGWNVPVPLLRGLARAGDAIGRLRRRRFFFDSDALEKLVGSAWYSSEKIYRELGYRPSIDFERALPELVAWYREVRS